VPTIPTTLSLRTLEQLTRHLRKQSFGVDVLPFFCMVDKRKSLHRASLAVAGDVAYLRTAIPYSSVVERMGVHRAPLATFAWIRGARLHEGAWVPWGRAALTRTVTACRWKSRSGTQSFTPSMLVRRSRQRAARRFSS